MWIENLFAAPMAGGDKWCWGMCPVAGRGAGGWNSDEFPSSIVTAKHGKGCNGSYLKIWTWRIESLLKPGMIHYVSDLCMQHQVDVLLPRDEGSRIGGVPDFCGPAVCEHWGGRSMRRCRGLHLPPCLESTGGHKICVRTFHVSLGSFGGWYHGARQPPRSAGQGCAAMQK